MRRSEPRLTRAQLEAWRSFGPEWNPFKQAWLERGFLLPPSGSADDDVEHPSQRSLLWQVLDARPHDIAGWVSEARGRTPHEVIAHVLARWHAVRDAVGIEDDERSRIALRRADRHDAERLADILEGVRR